MGLPHIRLSQLQHSTLRRGAPSQWKIRPEISLALHLERALEMAKPDVSSGLGAWRIALSLPEIDSFKC